MRTLIFLCASLLMYSCATYAEQSDIHSYCEYTEQYFSIPKANDPEKSDKAYARVFAGKITIPAGFTLVNYDVDYVEFINYEETSDNQGAIMIGKINPEVSMSDYISRNNETICLVAGTDVYIQVTIGQYNGGVAVNNIKIFNEREYVSIVSRNDPLWKEVVSSYSRR